MIASAPGARPTMRTSGRECAPWSMISAPPVSGSGDIRSKTPCSIRTSRIVWGYYRVDEIEEFSDTVGADPQPRVWRCRQILDTKTDKDGKVWEAYCACLLTNDPTIAASRCGGKLSSPPHCGLMFVRCNCSAKIDHCLAGARRPEDCIYTQID